MESDRFTMKYYVKSKKSGRIAAEGEGTIVFFDYHNNVKASIPHQIQERIRTLDFNTQ